MTVVMWIGVAVVAELAFGVVLGKLLSGRTGGATCVDSWVLEAWDHNGFACEDDHVPSFVPDTVGEAFPDVIPAAWTDDSVSPVIARR